MHIGIDLDNTVLDATTPHLHFYNMASGMSLTPDDVNDFYLYRMYGWNNVEREVVYTKYGHDIHWNSTPYPMAVEILQRLFKQHELSIITSRPLLFRDVTIDWLKHHKIDYHSLTLAENKLEICTQANVDILIDDGPHYAEEFVLANKPVILYEQPYNLTVSHNSVYRATNWNEVNQHVIYLAGKMK